MTPTTGNYGVVRTTGLVAAVIRLLTRSEYNHAYIYVDENTIIEAQAHGAVYSPAAKYAGHPRRGDNSDEPIESVERERIAHEAAALIGTPYFFLDIAALALSSFGIRPKWLRHRVARTDRLICSQLVDLACKRGGLHLFLDGRPSESVTPGDLAGRLVERPWERSSPLPVEVTP